MKPITFCIASANNEKEYTLLLIRSLRENTEISNHEILVFIDSDNQNTYEDLIALKTELPNLRVHLNKTGFPIGSQRNVSLLFNEASNDIVCYLHSDMVVGNEFDRYLVENLVDETYIVSCGRIEPPLHPPGPEKVVMDFGITPSEFKWEDFNNYVKKLQMENRPDISGTHGAFAINKKTWFDILGGYDTQFRCAAEDYDLVVRMRLNGITERMVWNACVYHFTCVSSRGKDWYKQDDSEIRYKNLLQEHAAIEERKRFIRKWGFFGHDPRPLYDIGLFIDMDRFADIQLLEYVEPYFTNIYINDKMVTRQLKETIEFKSHYYANLRWKYSHEHWESKSHLFTPVNFEKRIQYITDGDKNLSNNTIMSIKFSDLTTGMQNQNSQLRMLIENSHVIIDQNEVGKFEFEGMTIDIRQKKELSSLFKKVTITETLIQENFEFV